MNVRTNTIVDIIYKRLSEEVLTSSEQQQLLNWTQESEYNQQLLQQFGDDLLLEKYLREALSPDTLWNKFAEAVKGERVDMIPASGGLPASPGYLPHFIKPAWFKYAAIFLLIAGTAGFLYNAFQKPKNEIVSGAQNNKIRDIRPGGNRAILTLSDGSSIALDSAANGSLVLQGNTNISKLDSGSLAYNGDVTPSTGTIGYNTITTPRGGKYQITLSDGTKAWLNAASSIRYPVPFSGKDREVEVQGEVFFDVALDPAKPFMVKLPNNSSVKVLGTSFNVNAYTDEGLFLTTLITGSVRYFAGNNESLLKPGNQMRDKNAEIRGSVLKQLSDDEIQSVVAWRSGYFSVSHANLDDLFRQISRWYNVDITVKGRLPSRYVTMEISRSIPFDTLMKALEAYGVTWKYEERRVVLMP